MKHILFAFSISMLFFPALLLDARAQGSAATDRTALEALYDATDGDNWFNNYNWKTSESLGNWEGVTVNSDGRVIGLFLSDNGLSGEIPSQIGNLSALQVLDLESNALPVSIPKIGNLSFLQGLDLESSGLTGEIPPEIGNLSFLQGLFLNRNDLTGEIPPEIGNLSALEELDLAANALTGEIPPEIGNLSALQVLDLEVNALTGKIPSEIGNLSVLERLRLSFNDLTGAIPSEIGNLSALRSLNMSYTDLTGAIPSEIGNLLALRSLNLNRTDLTGAIPSEIGNLSALEFLDLSFNNLTGAIPPEIGNLSKLFRLGLGDNDLTGAIPETFSNLLNLLSFYTEGLPNVCLPVSLVQWHAGIATTNSIFHCSSAEELTLFSNYPNPFNLRTTIDYVLPEASHVRLFVYDMTGRIAGVLVDRLQPSGFHSVRFDASNLPTGSYLYRLAASGETRTGTMTLVR